MKCRKCRMPASAMGADGYPYCTYDAKFAPKPVTRLETNADGSDGGEMASGEARDAHA